MSDRIIIHDPAPRKQPRKRNKAPPPEVADPPPISQRVSSTLTLPALNLKSKTKATLSLMKEHGGLIAIASSPLIVIAWLVYYGGRY